MPRETPGFLFAGAHQSFLIYAARPRRGLLAARFRATGPATTNQRASKPPPGNWVDPALAHWVPTAPGEADDEGVGTAIVVTLLVLLAVGLVADQLLRLRRWLKKPPNSHT